MGLLALKRLVSMRRQGRQTQFRRGTSTASVAVANRKRSRCRQDGDPQAAKRTRHPVPELPKHFEDLFAGHFRERGRAILAACKYYMEGNRVGSVVPGEDDEGKELEIANAQGRPASFKARMEVLFEELLMEFNVKGADTRKFCEEKLKKSQSATA